MVLMANAPLRTLRSRTRSPRLAVGHQAQGEVKLVASGSLPNDGKAIADERPVGDQNRPCFHPLCG